MANIKHKPVTEKGKERMISWVRGKKLKITPDTFAKVFGLPCLEKPEFEFLDVGMLDLDAISQELLMGDDIWDGEVQCNKMRLKDRANLILAIGTRKTIDLPRMMFMAFCTAYESSDP
ncbi:hypothetical protein Acr_00g0090230 [Actinidia rufa]|uniref:Uncharacterized protein n=1 Tax=Actinidia rufa TaxID=165716 RepID=A0A7J0DX35_9ERIC|nr:hypothetical protein Acr_00g0090230 [Actinidia rufa]